MKKSLFYISLVAAALVSCSKTESPISIEEGKDCVVSISFIGEISTSESPMTKATTTSNNIYAIQAYSGDDPFAFGLFDDLSAVKLNLKQGSTYSFRVCMVKDAKSLMDYSLTNGGLCCTRYSTYPSPFGLSGYYDTGYYGDYLVLNRFFYKSNGFYQVYTSSTATSKTFREHYYYLSHLREGTLNGKYPSCNDWFYGEYSNYTPTEEVGAIDIPLKRTGFKIKYELSGVTDGEVTVKIYNDTKTFFENTTSTSTYTSDTQFIAFYDTYSAWQYADNYTENMTVAVTWLRGIGITQNLGTKTVQVKRNCLNNIKIKLGSDDRGAGVSLSTESESSMGTAESTIPVE